MTWKCQIIYCLTSLFLLRMTKKLAVSVLIIQSQEDFSRFCGLTNFFSAAKYISLFINCSKGKFGPSTLNRKSLSLTDRN